MCFSLDRFRAGDFCKFLRQNPPLTTTKTMHYSSFQREPMNQTAQHISPNPAQRLADKILARTNNGQDLIDLLHDIGKGRYDANKNDRITASNYLFDRGYGKCPRQSPAANPDQEHPPATDDNDVAALREAPSAVPHTEAESPRLVTQIDDALNESLGPAPSAHAPTHHSDSSTRHSGEEPAPYPIRGRNPEGWSGASHHASQPVGAGFKPARPSDSPETPEPFDPSYIQAYIIEITNDGDTLIDTLMEIAYAADDDTTVTSHHRTRAGRILADRGMGTDPNALRSAVCPDCRRKWTNHPGSHDRPEPSHVADETEEEPFDKEVWDGIIAELNQMEEQGLITPDPDAPEVDMSAYDKWTDEQIAPYAAEAAAKLWNDIDLRLERQKQWPEIEERRRKKLAQIYPSHSDGEQPDT